MLISSWPIYQAEHSPLALVSMKEQSCSSQAPQGLPLRLFSSGLVSRLQHPPVAPLLWRPTGLAGSCSVPSPLVPVGIFTALDEKLLTLVQVPPPLVQPRPIHFHEWVWMGVEGKERGFSQVMDQ